MMKYFHFNKFDDISCYEYNGAHTHIHKPVCWIELIKKGGKSERRRRQNYANVKEIVGVFIIS